MYVLVTSSPAIVNVWYRESVHGDSGSLFISTVALLSRVLPGLGLHVGTILSSVEYPLLMISLLFCSFSV